MVIKLTEAELAARKEKILQAARWCFLNFGFAKTSLDDIAKRANISRTLLYKTYKDKEDIFSAVFAHWLVATQPAARAAAASPGAAYTRLMNVCRVMAIEPWREMVGAPMASEFYDACERLDPEIAAQHHSVARECAAMILGDEAAAEVFLLALDGLFADDPSAELFEQRVALLAARFVPPEETGRK